MLNVITLFSGYDSQALALNRLGLPDNPGTTTPNPDDPNAGND